MIEQQSPEYLSPGRLKGTMTWYGSYKDLPILAELYDHIPAYNNRPDVELYCEFAKNAQGRVLELGCGSGRILIPIARASVEITGVDLSEHMLKRCRLKLESETVEVQKIVSLTQSSMTAFELNEQFALVTIPFRAFQHMVTVDEQITCLKSVYRHLQPGGKLLFDVVNVDLKVMHTMQNNNDEEIENTKEFVLPDGRKLRRTHRIRAAHPEEQYNDVELYYHLTNIDGKHERFVQAFPMRYFFRE